MTWTPELASHRLETLMESKNLSEEDRDELRRFAAVLARLKDRAGGKTLPPAPEGMRDWLLGRAAL